MGQIGCYFRLSALDKASIIRLYQTRIRHSALPPKYVRQHAYIYYRGFALMAWLLIIDRFIWFGSHIIKAAW